MDWKTLIPTQYDFNYMIEYAEWLNSHSFIPQKGQAIVIHIHECDLYKLKIGDGVSYLDELPDIL